MEKSGISSYGASLNPHVQWRGRNVAGVHVMAACALGVDLGLHNGGPDHGRAGDEKAGGHALEGGEADLSLRMSVYTSGSKMMIMPRGLRLLI